MTEETQANEETQIDENDTQAGSTDNFSLLDADNPDTKEAASFKDGVRPDGLPDDLWDADNNSINTEALFNKWQQAEDRVKGLRGKLSKGEGQAPKDIGGYTLDLSEEESEALADVISDDDPVIGRLKEVCLENKISKEAYNSIVKGVGSYLQENVQSIAANEHLSEEDREALRAEEYKKIGPNAPAVVRAVTEWGRSLYQQGSFSEDDVQTLMSFGATGDGVRVLNIIRQLTGGDDIPMQAQVNDGLPSDHEIFDMMKGEKYMAGDAETHKKVDALLQKRIAAGRPERLQITA